MRTAWLPVAIGAPVLFVGVLSVGAFIATRSEPTVTDLRLTASFPASGTQRVPVRAPIEFWFDRELQAGTENGIVTVDPPVPVRLIKQGNSLRVEPSSEFEPGQTYSVSVDSIADVDGRKLRHPASVSFTTAAMVAAPAPDLGSPRGDQVASVPVRGASAGANRDAATEASVLGGQTTAVEAGALVRAQTPKLPGMRSGQVARVADVPTPSGAAVEGMVGNALGPTQQVRIMEQAFQGGVMLKVGGTDQVLVLLRSRGRWEKHTDTWSAGADSALAPGLPPPPGALAPTRAFGKLWNDSTDLRTALGWAVYEARETRAGVQQCEKGTAIAVGQLAYLLVSDGSWKAIPLGT